MKYYDNHMHSSFSTDSNSEPEEQIKAAIAMGLSGITFTDHYDPDFPEPGYTFNSNDYFSSLLSLKEKYKDKIEIRIGIELGLRSDQADILPEIVKDKPYDFVIGSIHVIDGCDPYYERIWQEKGTENVLRLFFEESARCAEMYDCYDSLGHFDYVYRYIPKEDAGKYPIELFSQYIDRTLKTLIAKDKALEINTAGWKYGLSAPNPGPDILKRYYELGGRKITIGSDGHQPLHLGYGFHRLASYLIPLGFNAYYVYEGRKPFKVALEAPEYKLAVFDMDGTILNTLEDLWSATNYALSAHSLPTHSIDDVRRFVGNGLMNLIRRAVPSGSSDELINDVFGTLIPYYEKHCKDKTGEYAGITDVLKGLRARGIRTAVVSNKADPAVHILAEEYFPGLFDIAIGERPGVNRKPSPDSVNEVLRSLNIDRKDAVYIGDSDVDAMTAKNADMDCIGVTWGFRDEALLRQMGVKIIAHNPEELLDII